MLKQSFKQNNLSSIYLSLLYLTAKNLYNPYLHDFFLTLTAILLFLLLSKELYKGTL